MFNIIYKITNKLNGKIYIGKHITDDLDDGYMGSGKLIKSAIEKYGIKNFDKETLYIFDNENDMNNKEREIVNEDFVKDNNTYNLMLGGTGGFTIYNLEGSYYKDRGFETKAEWNKFISPFGKPGYEWILEKARLRFVECKGWVKGSEAMKEFHSLNPEKAKEFSKLSKSDSAIKKWKEKNDGFQTGRKNSQFGTMWITDGSKNQKIKKDMVIPIGWYKGRTVV